MVDMRSIYPLIMSADVDSSTAFYTEVVGLEVAFDHRLVPSVLRAGLTLGAAGGDRT